MTNIDNVEHKPRLDYISEYLTPSLEEQLVLILKEECPHNGGWVLHAWGHHGAFACKICGKVKWY